MPVNRASLFGAIQVDDMHHFYSVISEALCQIKRIFVICLLAGRVTFPHLYDIALADRYRRNYLDHYCEFIIKANLQCKAETTTEMPKKQQIICGRRIASFVFLIAIFDRGRSAIE